MHGSRGHAARTASPVSDGGVITDRGRRGTRIVDGKREPMGEMDLAYDTADASWKAEFSSPRVKTVWRLSVDGTHLTGTGRLLPGNQTIRKIDARKE
jgi:hypothetical protein